MDPAVDDFRMPGSARTLSHIPGGTGLPWLGHIPAFILDARGLVDWSYARYGRCFRHRFRQMGSVVMLGEDALELVLRDRERAFSSELGWGLNLRRLFSRGLMLRDFDEHRAHRRIMQGAFRRSALVGYLEGTNLRVAEALGRWRADDDFRFYPHIKQLALDNAASIFMGMPLGAQADRINQAFVDTVAASVTLTSVAAPGSALWRGIRARRVLVEILRPLIPGRREGEGGDLLGQLCRAQDDDGRSFDDEEVVDHMIFLLMAAHDTVTSALTTTAYYLAANPSWQQRLRARSEAVGIPTLDYDTAMGLTLHAQVFDEALRLRTPVPYIARRTVKEVEFDGHRIPDNTHVSVVPDFTHRDPRLWTHPGRVDPDRFSKGRAEHEGHRYAFVPFGAGAHVCLGSTFAYLLAKVFVHQLLLRYELSLPNGYEPQFQQVPIPKPRDGLRLVLRPLG